ncbi:metallophosphoesterase family protein [Desulforhopalus sp. IMCC35007]|uniref:metallophosphoesterase family protein n=1 Tax=Desulforhopalus sp. IMCC35007 TaxID=2569543 RepID=UPI0010ADD533|nr:metallophosphoesterase family protein [Desulforhopalus sp. IMCC35007]TKB12202.1 metallophosphoesterase [Desulforhopalus sp. IMCC35007]
MYTIGIISDTHLQQPDHFFLENCVNAFKNCDAIIHAGDLTDHSILSVFSGKTVYAVRGNMCNLQTQRTLPERKTVSIKGYTIGISHGAGPRHNIEERVYEMFPEADCIIYGHTHIPVCHYYGTTLLINPGSFQSTSRYGGPGTYALLQIDSNGLHGSLHNLPVLQ